MIAGITVLVQWAPRPNSGPPCPQRDRVLFAVVRPGLLPRLGGSSSSIIEPSRIIDQCHGRSARRSFASFTRLPWTASASGYYRRLKRSSATPGRPTMSVTSPSSGNSTNGMTSWPPRSMTCVARQQSGNWRASSTMICSPMKRWRGSAPRCRHSVASVSLLCCWMLIRET